jgi:DNA-binding HxlR family transcriptional regulator
VLDQIGDKWSFSIFAVLEDSPKRFNEIRRLIGDISHRVLTKKLRELERESHACHNGVAQSTNMESGEAHFAN